MLGWFPAAHADPLSGWMARCGSGDDDACRAIAAAGSLEAARHAAAEPRVRSGEGLPADAAESLSRWARHQLCNRGEPVACASVGRLPEPCRAEPRPWAECRAALAAGGLAELPVTATLGFDGVAPTVGVTAGGVPWIRYRGGALIVGDEAPRPLWDPPTAAHVREALVEVTDGGVQAVLVVDRPDPSLDVLARRAPEWLLARTNGGPWVVTALPGTPHTGAEPVAFSAGAVLFAQTLRDTAPPTLDLVRWRPGEAPASLAQVHAWLPTWERALGSLVLHGRTEDDAADVSVRVRLADGAVFAADGPPPPLDTAEDPARATVVRWIEPSTRVQWGPLPPAPAWSTTFPPLSLDLPPAPPGDTTLRDPAGRAVWPAWVEAFPAAERRPAYTTGRGEPTGPDGSVDLGAPPPGPYVLGIHGVHGFRAARWDGRGPVVVGAPRVRLPAADGVLWVRRGDDGWWSRIAEDAPIVSEPPSEGDELWFLTAVGAFRARRWHTVGERTDPEWEALPGRTLRVVDQRGHPRPGVPVHVTAGGPLPPAFTDATGRVTILSAPSLPSTLPFEVRVDWLVVRDAAAVDVVLPLPDGLDPEAPWPEGAFSGVYAGDPSAGVWALAPPSVRRDGQALRTVARSGAEWWVVDAGPGRLSDREPLSPTLSERSSPSVEVALDSAGRRPGPKPSPGPGRLSDREPLSPTIRERSSPSVEVALDSAGRRPGPKLNAGPERLVRLRPAPDGLWVGVVDEKDRTKWALLPRSDQ